MLIPALILLGPAIEDSVSGKSVLVGVAIRTCLFVSIAFYAWGMVVARTLAGRKVEGAILSMSNRGERLMIITNFLVGLPVMLLCLALQASVTFWCVRYYIRQANRVPSDYGIRPLLVTMVAMMFGTLLQVVVWGCLFLWLDEFTELYEAVYHSTVNFASLGYGDIVMSKPWKMLGPLEAINGVMMLGMSAAALVTILQQMIRSQQDKLAHKKGHQS